MGSNITDLKEEGMELKVGLEIVVDHYWFSRGRDILTREIKTGANHYWFLGLKWGQTLRVLRGRGELFLISRDGMKHYRLRRGGGYVRRRG